MGSSIIVMMLSLFIRLLIPASIVGIIIFLVYTDNSRKNIRTGNGQYPPAYNAQGIPVKKPSRFNTSTVLMMIGTAFIILSAVAFVAANWVKMSDEGRVFILAGAAILSFAISVIVKAVAKLELTSSGFYILGTMLSVVTLITAGNYKLFGEWFSVGGGGTGLLFAVGSFIIAAAALAAYPIYKRAAYPYIGLSFISLGLIFLSVQLSDNYEQFAPIIIMVQLVITATVHILRPHKGTKLEAPVRIIGDITAIFYAILAGFYVLGTTFNATPFTFFILGVVILQLFFYGVFRKQKWMFIILNLIAVYTAFVAVFCLHDKFGTDFVMLFFAFIALGIYTINRFTPKNSPVSEAITFTFACIGAVLSLCADNDRYFGVNVIVPLAVSFFITLYTLHKELGIQVTAGLAAPILPFFTALYLNNRFYEMSGRELYPEINTLTFGGLAIVYIAVTMILMYLPKIAFSVHAHNPLKTEVVLYSNMIAAGAVLLNCTGFNNVFMVAAAVCIIHFIASNLMSCNITAAGSVISLILLTNRILQHYCGEGSDDAMLSMFGLFAVLLVISRLVFPESFITKKNNRTMVDVILLSSWMCVIPFPTFDRLSIFLRLMAVAVFLAGFIKKKTDKEAAAVLLSFSAFIAAFACITRPFLTTDSSVINSKITLAIIALLGLAYRFIWKQHRIASRVTSTILFVISFIGLIVDAMVFHNAPNTIFAMAVTAGLLLIAFYSKNMTWFAVTSIALVVITVFSTRKYFATMGWWIYLFIVGLVLIIVAAVNEYCKKRGETMKSAATKTFSEWKW